MIAETAMTTAQDRNVHTTEAVRTTLWHTVSHKDEKNFDLDGFETGLWFDRATSKEYDWIPLDEYGEEAYWPDLRLAPATTIVIWRSM